VLTWIAVADSVDVARWLAVPAITDRAGQPAWRLVAVPLHGARG
jgi:hypothetical protein